MFRSTEATSVVELIRADCTLDSREAESVVEQEVERPTARGKAATRGMLELRTTLGARVTLLIASGIVWVFTGPGFESLADRSPVEQDIARPTFFGTEPRRGVVTERSLVIALLAAREAHTMGGVGARSTWRTNDAPSTIGSAVMVALCPGGGDVDEGASRCTQKGHRGFGLRLPGAARAPGMAAA
jgi:hypothetical protein